MKRDSYVPHCDAGNAGCQLTTVWLLICKSAKHGSGIVHRLTEQIRRIRSTDFHEPRWSFHQRSHLRGHHGEEPCCQVNLCSTVPSPPDCTLLYLKAFLVTYLLMHLYRSLASLPARYRELRMLSSVKEPSFCCCTVSELAAGRALLRKQLCIQCWLSCCVVKSCTVARCCSLC